MDADARTPEEQKTSVMERVQQFIDNDRKKIGGMHLGAMLRLGLAELREAFSWPGGTIAQSTPYGMLGTLTPGEVYSARKENLNTNLSHKDQTMDANRMPTPSEIAYATDRGGAGQDHGQERAQSHDQGERSQNSSPSQIADSQQTSAPEQQRGHDHDRGMER
jgi:hypothetical protein